MKSIKTHSKLLAACMALISVIALLKASYYKPDFFPIGLTGLGWVGNPPYGNVPIPTPWKWTPAESDNNEQDLIEALGINCIGCEDAHPRTLINLKADLSGSDTTDYLHMVCKPLAVNGTPTVYIITANYYAVAQYWDYLDTMTVDTTVSPPDTTWHMDGKEHIGTWPHLKPCVFFRTPYRGLEDEDDTTKDQPGYGAPKFGHIGYNRFGTDTDNWQTCDGDTFSSYGNGLGYWRTMADDAVTNFFAYCSTNTDNVDYIWGYNLLTEDGGMYRNSDADNPWHGCWAGMDRIINGGETNFPVEQSTKASHSGIRGAEESLGTANRMIVAKGGTWPLHKGNINIFEELPDVDAFVVYSETWCRAKYNYGEQVIFDAMLYEDSSVAENIRKGHPGRGVKSGYHNTAIYFQENAKWDGKTHRRWIPGIGTKWYKVSTDGTKAFSRRPCPPELRCVVYLCLSRGAKGILFHPWLTKYANNTIDDIPSTITIPCTTSGGSYTIGLRDCDGVPFDGSKPHHKLNESAASPATFWSGRTDSTYYYLSEYLIDEIKAISDVLMQLEWDSAYSLASTMDTLAKPCPHGYVDTVTTTDSGYIELGFFSPYYWQDFGKYLMVVNRDGIADNEPDSITLYLDFPDKDSLHVVEYGDPNTDTILVKDTSDNRFHLARDYEPGEGKLFRFYPIETGKEFLMLKLWGECKETGAATGPMGPLSEGNTYCAELTWEWAQYKPPDLDSMKLWRKDSGTWNCIDSHPTWKWKHTDTVFMNCDSCCAEFLEVGYHDSGYEITEPEELSGAVGTKSNIEEVCCNKTSGCPDLYTFIYEDTTVSPGHLFLENNTILPHSEHVQALGLDLLRLDMINDDPDHYYLNISENAYATSYLDQVKLWVVDHAEGTEVATSTDDSIYVYSEMAAPISCKDNQDNDRLDEVLWQDSLSFVGPPNSYVIAEFDDPEWTNKGILVFVDGAEMAKACKIDLYKVGGGGEGWDSIGVTYARLNSSQWLINVSDADSLRFRLTCGGSDTIRINRIALVKLETSGWTKTAAALDSAVKYDTLGGDLAYRTPYLLYQDTLVEILSPTYPQLSLRFDKIDSSITYSLRDYVFQSHGYYYSPMQSPQSGIEEGPLQFGLRVEQLTPLSRVAFINYSVPYATHVKIAAYDVVGRLIKCIVDEEVKAGRYSEEWKGKDEAGRKLASGIYFVKMTTDDYKKTVKVVILK